MQTLDLSAYGVVEMTEKEMKEVNGGWIITATLFALGIAAHVYNNWDVVVDAWNAGFNGEARPMVR